MKHFCLEKFFLLSFFTVCLVACGTVEPPETDERFVPDGYLKFTLNPNDNVPGDSIDANFAHGVRIFVHPKAHYELSFDKDVYAQEKPQLRLFRVYWDDRVKKNFPSWVRTVDPVEENGRYVYDFVCGESDRSVWVTSLNDGEDFYKGKTKNVRLKAYGSYSDHFSVNLIVAGKIKDLDVSYDSLARMLQHGFDRFYTSVKVDTVYVRYANEHPILGKRYSKSEPWIAGRTSDNQMMTELGGWPEPDVYDALDVVLVHRFKQEGLLGLSDLFAANLGGGSGSTVVVANHNRQDGVDMVVNAERIVYTALHEIGHFFGLRHTTATRSDQESNGDYSVFDDGFSDTPYCFEKTSSKAFLVKKGVTSDFRQPFHQFTPRYDYTVSYQALSDISRCPDASNLMFPMESEKQLEGFSKQQLEVIRENLMLMPH